MKINEFKGSETIVGEERTCEVRHVTKYDALGNPTGLQPEMTISPCDADLARRLLGILSGVTGEQARREVAIAAADAQTEPKADAKKAAGRKKDKAADASTAVAVEPAPDDNLKFLDADAQAQLTLPHRGPGPKHVDAAALPDTVKNATSMRDLLTWLAEKGGVTSIDAMVVACEDLKPVVSILTKVPDVGTRVRRACDVLALFSTEVEAAG